VSDLTELVDRYLAVWNEPDADARGRAVAELWTEGGGYTDPLAAVEGPAAINGLIGAAREQLTRTTTSPASPGTSYRLAAASRW
jgi:hypothetical protein